MQTKKSKKTHRLYWVSTVVLILVATIGWMRFQQALRHWYYLSELDVWPPPIYFAISGGLIGILYSLGLVFHLSKQIITRLYIRMINWLLIIWVWVDRFFFINQDYFNQLLSGTIFISVCLLGFDLLIFRNNTYFQKANEDAQEN